MSLLRLCLCVLALSAVPIPAIAQTAARTTQLMDVLGVADVARIMRVEGMAYAEDLNTDLLDGQGGALWNDQIARIYDLNRMSETVRTGLSDGLDAAQTDAAIAFFSSPVGTRIVELENAARAAMIDPEIEEIARARYVELEGTDDPRLALVAQFVTVNDLLERNVSGALSSNFQFLSGLADGGATEMSEDEIIADVWGQEDEIREDTRSWVFGYLLMAYQPLTDDELRRYIAFSKTPDGMALNAALFAGFDAMYLDISYALGRAVSLNQTSSDL